MPPESFPFTSATIVLLIGFGSIGAGSYYLCVRYLRRFAGDPLSQTVVRRSRINALICAAGILAVWSLLTMAGLAIFGLPFKQSRSAAFEILLLGLLVWTCIAGVRDRLASGPLVMDCGPLPGRGFILAFTALMAISSLLALAGGSDKTGWQRAWDAGEELAISFFLLVLSLGRLQIRRNGIWWYGSLFRWDRMKSVEWDGSTLLLQTQSSFPFFAQSALQVPREHKAAFEELLARHCPAKTGAA